MQARYIFWLLACSGEHACALARLRGEFVPVPLPQSDAAGRLASCFLRQASHGCFNQGPSRICWPDTRYLNELEAEGIENPLSQPFTLAAVLNDLCMLAEIQPPAAIVLAVGA